MRECLADVYIPPLTLLNPVCRRGWEEWPPSPVPDLLPEDRPPPGGGGDNLFGCWRESLVGYGEMGWSWFSGHSTVIFRNSCSDSRAVLVPCVVSPALCHYSFSICCPFKCSSSTHSLPTFLPSFFQLLIVAAFICSYIRSLSIHPSNLPSSSTYSFTHPLFYPPSLLIFHPPVCQLVVRLPFHSLLPTFDWRDFKGLCVDAHCAFFHW